MNTNVFNLQKLIENNPDINLTIKASELKEFAQIIAAKTASAILEKQQEKLYTRKEVLEKFQISEATLCRWYNHGEINKIRVGGRIMYSETEIQRIIIAKSNK